MDTEATNNKSLTKNNTLPFLASAIIYCCLLGAPFLLFISLRALPASLGAPEHDTLPSQSLPVKPKTEDEKEENNKPITSSDTSKANKPNDKNNNEQQKTTKEVEQAANTDKPNAGTGNQNFELFNGDDTSINGDDTPKPSQWYLDKESTPFIVLTRLAIFSSVLSFGALGAAISLITRARSDQGVPSGITKKEIFSIQTVGAVFALILSLLFMGAMIGGTLFPNSDEFYYVIYIPAAFAKLLVWSFIAGFAERFVPNLLNNFLRQAENEKRSEETQQRAGSV